MRYRPQFRLRQLLFLTTAVCIMCAFPRTIGLPVVMCVVLMISVAGADGFSVAWTGSLKPATTGNYTFYTTSDDGVRLYVNGQLVINNWTDHGATENASKAVSLTGGQIYAVRMEYYEHVGSAVAQLRWSSPQVAKALIPQSVLFSGSPIVQGAAVVRSALVAAPSTTSTTSSSAPSHSSVAAGSIPPANPAIDTPAEKTTIKGLS